MNGKQIALLAVLAAFSALTALAVYEYGYIGFFDAVFSNLVGIVCMADLAIALTLVLVWMTRDAREVGISPLPYVVLTFALGSVGPLLYLIRREGKLARSAPRMVRATA